MRLGGREHRIHGDPFHGEQQKTGEDQRHLEIRSGLHHREAEARIGLTTRPRRALMMWMLSARNAASRRSCVTRMTVKPSLCQRSRSMHHSSYRVKASSAAK